MQRCLLLTSETYLAPTTCASTAANLAISMHARITGGMSARLLGIQNL
ncbi:hypothetical protein [Picosynechococcus sp. PCC 7002]|nr:hypothetical protein [Picosynechococcus sp. PCC 7002]